MIRFAADGIVGFSVAPLRFVSRLGYLISIMSFLGVAYVLGVRLFAPETTVPGWAFVMIVMFLLGGIQMIMLGVLGSYIGRTYVQSQRRPLYAVQLVSRSAQPNAQVMANGSVAGPQDESAHRPFGLVDAPRG